MLLSILHIFCTLYYYEYKKTAAILDHFFHMIV